MAPALPPLSRALRHAVVDGVATMTCRAALWTGQRLRRSQTGVLGNRALSIMGELVLLLVAFSYLAVALRARGELSAGPQTYASLRSVAPGMV